MAQSGDKTWSVTRDDIILSALRKIGEYDSADGPSTAEKTDAALALNALVKEWTAEGLGIWLRQKTCVFLSYGQPFYWLGANPLEDTTNFTWYRACPDSGLKQSILTANSTTATLTIDDTSWLTADHRVIAKPTSGFVGVRLDNRGIFWSTIIAAGANSLTMAVALPSQASAGNHVYTFPTRTSRPIRALSAFREDVNGITTAVQLIGRVSYEELSNKYSDGDPTQACFENAVMDNGTGSLHSRLFVWPINNSMSVDKLWLITEHYADDFDAASNNPQFPVEWANALIWNLALEMSFEYGLPTKDRQQLMMMAEMKKANLINSADIENASLSLEPDSSWR